MSTGSGRPDAPAGAAPGSATSGHAPDGESLVLTGRVEEAGVADILRTLLRSRETALVEFERSGAKKTVWVQEGRIVFAGSSDPDERLGECMLRAGLISVEQYDESSNLIRPGKRQGTILVELGYASPSELVQGVTVQVECIVLDLFHWRAGSYRIDMREFDTKELITLSVSTEHLVFTGTRRSAGWSQVRRGLGGSMETVLAQASDADARLYRLDLSEDDMHVYSLANGRLTVAQICAMAYKSSHDTCLTLYALACCGILVPVAADEDARQRARVAELELAEIGRRLRAFNDACAPIDAALSARLGDEVSALREAVMAAVIDEHYDVLRQVDLIAALPVDRVLENAAAVQPGWRGPVVDRAIGALEAAIAREAGRVLGRGVEEQVAAAFGARRPA